MKKTKLIIGSLLLLTLASCGGGETTSSEEIVSSEQIVSVEVSSEDNPFSEDENSNVEISIENSKDIASITVSDEDSSEEISSIGGIHVGGVGEGTIIDWASEVNS